MQVLSLHSSNFNIFIGDFNVNWLNEKEKLPLQNLFMEENNYRQLVSLFTTDNRTTIDHIYTNLPQSQVSGIEILEGRYLLQVAGCRLQVEKWTFKSE